MKRIAVLLMGLCVLASSVNAGKRPKNAPLANWNAPSPRVPLAAAAADTFNLGWFSFDVAGLPSQQGWSTVDLTAQLATFFHVASNAGELNGGALGNLLPLDGLKSMWCGVSPSTSAPFCGWATLPGYGNNWDQIMISSTLAGDSVRASYKVFWDAEPGYDGTTFEYSGDGGATWTQFPVAAGLTQRPDIYDLGPTTLVETFNVGGLGSVTLRFRFQSDLERSDEDGLWPTDGAILIDSLSVATFAGGLPATSDFEDFEAAADGATVVGIWTATTPVPFGNFGALYPGVTLLQEDPCFTQFSNLWAWFDDPLSTNYNCHVPDPRPGTGAVPFGGPGTGGVYLSNEIWSPAIANIGAGNQYTLEFLVYKDLPLDNLQFFTWKIRSIDALGCPGAWRDHEYVYYGGHRNWLRFTESIGDLIDPGAANIQIAVGVVDLCGIWCNSFGTGVCHSHAPLIDEVHIKRINTVGPRFSVRHIDLFQDNFAADGTLTGTARADKAEDILPSHNGAILPGDSVNVSISGLGSDVVNGGPAAYAYVRVQGSTLSGAQMEAPETRGAFGKRWPLVGTRIAGGFTYQQFRMDTIFTVQGVPVAGRFSIDLNDNVFTPGDTVHYFFGADDGLGNETFFHRTLQGQGGNNVEAFFNRTLQGQGGNNVEAFFNRTLRGQGGNNITQDVDVAGASPMEFTILPAGGVASGGDILYVDGADDRGGPTQLFFDTAFDYLSLSGLVDRFDVLDSSVLGGNSLASRVQNVANQIIGPYQKIIWNTGNLEVPPLGDGGTNNGGGHGDKSDDFALLFQLLDTDPSNPGVYFSGDELATLWAVTLTGASAVNTRSIYMNFNLDPAAPGGDHKNAGEPISPILDGVGTIGTDQLVVYGGCAIVNKFDLLTATGLSVAEYNNVASGKTYVLSQSTPNSAASTARVVLSGFSFHYVRDVGPPGSVPARVTHLRNILQFLQNTINVPVGFDDAPQFANVLKPNYPNPFNPSTLVAYEIREQGHVSLKVYNAAGQLVRTLVNQVQTPQVGGFSVTWDGKNNAGQNVASGVYFYKLVARNFTHTRKMVLLK